MIPLKFPIKKKKRCYLLNEIGCCCIPYGLGGKGMGGWGSS